MLPVTRAVLPSGVGNQELQIYELEKRFCLKMYLAPWSEMAA
jgi:hypothetical protein